MTRTTWQDLYCIEETGDIESRSSFDTTNGVGVGDGVFRALSRTRGDISFPNRIKFIPRISGISEPTTNEILESINSLSSIGYAFNLDAYILTLFGKVLFQGGSQTTLGSYYRYTMTPYTSEIPIVFLSTVKATPDNGDSIGVDTSSTELWGGLVTSLNITGGAGSVMSLNAGISGCRYNRTNIIGEISNDPRLNFKLGKDNDVPVGLAIYREHPYDSFNLIDSSASNIATDADFTDPDSLGAGSVEISNATGNLNFSSSDLSSYSNQNIRILYTSGSRASDYEDLAVTVTDIPDPLKFQNSTILIDSSAVACNAMDLSITCSVEPKYYEERNSYKYLMGKINSTLTLDIPLGDTNFGSAKAFYGYMKESDHRIQIYWGNAAPNLENQIALNLNGRIKLPAYGSSGSEVLSKVSFELMNNTTYESIEMVAAYYSSKLDRS